MAASLLQLQLLLLLLHLASTRILHTGLTPHSHIVTTVTNESTRPIIKSVTSNVNTVSLPSSENDNINPPRSLPLGSSPLFTFAHDQFTSSPVTGGETNQSTGYLSSSIDDGPATSVNLDNVASRARFVSSAEMSHLCTSQDEALKDFENRAMELMQKAIASYSESSSHSYSSNLLNNLSPTDDESDINIEQLLTKDVWKNLKDTLVNNKNDWEYPKETSKEYNDHNVGSRDKEMLNQDFHYFDNLKPQSEDLQDLRDLLPEVEGPETHDPNPHFSRLPRDGCGGSFVAFPFLVFLIGTFSAGINIINNINNDNDNGRSLWQTTEWLSPAMEDFQMTPASTPYVESSINSDNPGRNSSRHPRSDSRNIADDIQDLDNIALNAYHMIRSSTKQLWNALSHTAPNNIHRYLYVLFDDYKDSLTKAL